MRAFGVAAEVLEQARADIAQRNKDAVHYVWPENWHAVLAFIEMETQWRLVPTMTSVLYQGLEYASLPVVLAALKPRVPAACCRPLASLMPQLRSMERHAAVIRNGQ